MRTIIVRGALPLLTLLPSTDPDPSVTSGLPLERPLNRGALLEIAPDREALLMGCGSAEDIRMALRIRVAPGSADAHWLFHTQPDKDAKTRDVSLRTSKLVRSVTNIHEDVLTVSKVVVDVNEEEDLPPTPPPKDARHRPGSDRSKRRRITEDLSMEVDTEPPSPARNGHPQSRRKARVRRSISASALPSPRRTRGPSRWADAPPIPNVENGFLTNGHNWGSLRLSTPERLVSPRPTSLPTHILVLFTESETCHAKLSLPINDLLFALHVPNLSNVGELPHKLPNELPRVLMRVSRLEGWRELVIWMHTRNQARLMRSVLPEWVRDLVHPLSLVILATSGEGESVDGSAKRKLKPKKSLMTLAGRGVLRKNTATATLTIPGATVATQATLDSIAQEIAEMDTARGHGGGDDSQTLVAAMMKLNILRENLTEIGFYGRDLWVEIGVYWEVLVRAVNWQAKMGTGHCGGGLM
ncbi:hypothetical protein BV22DRAFT_1192374 [Leucogyrophana mollusca]|uniref:Uncharacterized protein n=1 Tax=Leucogyrophana mollusca TaxID=85980 RepID=A0ACB8BTZ0_9AGAM|nr:hypothetical protein BV22DRAFT_1192374 [Leucogyrophana mollusca]